MAWKLYDYGTAGENEIAEWTRRHINALAKLNAKLDMLEMYGPDLPPNLLADLGSHIFKLKVRGNVQLRPHLCAGPLNEMEFTILVGATEKDDELSPANAKEIAIQRRAEILKNPSRRVPHERVAKKAKK